MTVLPIAEPGPRFSPPRRTPDIGFGEFVALIAALMATNAMAIDSMLPALAAIGTTFAIAQPNHQQWVITFYLLGFGAAQLIYGTISDRYGRKPVLVVGLVVYTLCCVVCAGAPSFPILLFARATQGIGAAASRVVSTAIVRDLYGGRQMARVLSLASIVFMLVPIIAPSLGQLIMLVAPWRAIFGAMAAFAMLVTAWTIVRLPETQHPEDRMPIAFNRIAAAVRLILTNRIAVGYTLATTLMLGAMFAFLNSAQQVFGVVFKVGRLFSVNFGVIALSIALASLLNSRIVVRLGTRRVAHTALTAFVGCAVVHLAVVISGIETIWTFSILQAVMMFCFALVPSNFSATSMEPLRHVAGTASSAQGFVTVLGGALLGFAIGQQFNGTVLPLITGYVVLGSAALIVVLITERGHLYQWGPQKADAWQGDLL